MPDKIYVKEREIVVPGDLLAEGLQFLPSGKAFREGKNLYASTVGLVSIKGRVLKIIPLAGKYLPKKDDIIIGKITSINFSGWSVDIDSPYMADLNIGEATSEYIDLHKVQLSRYFDIDDYILAGVIKLTESKFVKLTTKGRPFRKLRNGNIIEVSPTKIPGIIGKQGSMIKILKETSGCDVVIGQNGLVWISGDPKKIMLVTNAIKMIEEESHLSGLTDKITKLLRGGK